MKERDLQTVRPRWVCGTQEKEVEQVTYDLEKSLSSLEVDAEDPEQQCGQRRLRTMLDPMLQSQSEVEQHCLTHMPYRNWCPNCVRGRGKEMDHRSKRGTEEESLPEYHMDCCFPGDDGGQKLTILVVERHSKMKKAVVVPSKGSTGRYAVRMVVDLIEEWGDKDRTVNVKSDQEPAIKFLVDDVCMARTGARTIVEQAPKGSKGSNGIVERAVQSTEQYLRTLKSALDERMNVRIDTKHPVLTWLREFAGYMMNRRCRWMARQRMNDARRRRLRCWAWCWARKSSGSHQQVRRWRRSTPAGVMACTWVCGQGAMSLSALIVTQTASSM